jgi:hypothetical protein
MMQITNETAYFHFVLALKTPIWSFPLGDPVERVHPLVNMSRRAENH